MCDKHKKSTKSGNFYRTLKRKRDEENEVQSNLLNRMLNRNSSQTSIVSNDTANQNVAASISPIQSNETANSKQNESSTDSQIVAASISQISNQLNDITNSDQNELALSSETDQAINEMGENLSSGQKLIDEAQVFEMENINVADPSTWPNNISKKIREYIVDSVQILPVLTADYSFPKSKSGRSFNAKLYYSTNPNQSPTFMAGLFCT